MPTYIFKDRKSEEIFELQMKISELDKFKLKNPKLIQLPTAPSFRLKGSGWYETDFKTGNKKNISKEESKKEAVKTNNSNKKNTKDSSKNKKEKREKTKVKEG